MPTRKGHDAVLRWSCAIPFLSTPFASLLHRELHSALGEKRGRRDRLTPQLRRDLQWWTPREPQHPPSRGQPSRVLRFGRYGFTFVGSHGVATPAMVFVGPQQYSYQTPVR
jgi:hypothetical protein